MEVQQHVQTNEAAAELTPERPPVAPLSSEMAVRSPSVPSSAEVASKPAGSEAGMNTYALVIMGRAGVGKTALTIRFVRDRFVEDYDPTIEDVHEKQFDVYGAGGLQLCLEIRDTAGQESYSALRSSWMQHASGFLFVFSLVDRQTFDELRSFQDELMDCFDDDPPPSVLVANKSDLDRSQWVVTDEEVQQLKNSWKNCGEVVYTSAKAGRNVGGAFERLSVVVHERVIFQRLQHSRKEHRALAAQASMHRQVGSNVCRMLQCKEGCFTQ